MVATRRGLTVPVASKLELGNTHVNFSSIPLAVHTEVKFDKMMSALIDLEAASDPLHHHVYDRLGTLPVRRLVELDQS